MITAILHLFGALLGTAGTLFRVAFHLFFIFLGLPFLFFSRRRVRAVLLLAGFAALAYHLANRNRVNPPRNPPVITI
ncbi:MAG TPA: hypothetical protein VGR78_03725 [Verrucomicrobiae bacterium]|jgi:hypothetical protein|nr:hypothetical protein [Verrucomicrobiae bacterium]